MPPAEAVTGFRIVIRFPDGRTEQLVVDSDRVLIGSGAHCEIRLPAEFAAVEHVQLAFVGGGIHAQARAMQPLPTIDGTGFTQTPVLPDAILGVGPVQIWASQTVIADNPNVIRKKTQPTSPLTYVLAVLAIPLAGYVLLYDEPQDRPTEAPAEVPALWGAPVTTCPQNAADQALALGQEKR
jgi:hypothetical protein